MATARQRHGGCGDRYSAGNWKAEERLDRRSFGEQDFLMSRAAV
jgi:hypothetical protein